MHWQEGQPADLQERKQWPWWKAKKWMLHISHRLFQRYGDPKLTNPGSPERTFAELYKRHCSAQFLEAHMTLLAGIPKVSLCTPELRSCASSNASGPGDYTSPSSYPRSSFVVLQAM